MNHASLLSVNSPLNPEREKKKSSKTVSIRCSRCNEVKPMDEVIIDAKENVCKVCIKGGIKNGKEK